MKRPHLFFCRIALSHGLHAPVTVSRETLLALAARVALAYCHDRFT
ncbi:MAG: hypothetical protein RMJ43_07935 [Chloroherpetonaceae bacterium]|nr:hypothetical protein [Chloroherpetonaceae bacterium]